MAWKAGSGIVAVGVCEMKKQNASRDVDDAILPKGYSVIVSEMKFKMI
jgi:hypothetical protein